MAVEDLDKKQTVDKKIQLLRPLELTVGQLDEAIGWPFDPAKVSTEKDGLPCSPVDEEYKDSDKQLLEQFKKIYHTGTASLESFIKNLQDEKEIGPESIIYFVSQVLNGPLGKTAFDLGKNEKNFNPAPDIMGVAGDHKIANRNNAWARANSSTPVHGPNVPTNCAAVTFNKCPGFMQVLLQENSQNVQGVFNTVTDTLVSVDNTKPQIDKRPKRRKEDENRDGHNHQPYAHGNVNVKDVETFIRLKEIHKGIMEKVEKFLGEEAWKLCVFKKVINYFDPGQNKASSTNETISRVLEYMVKKFEKDKNGVEKETITTEKAAKETDLFGNAFNTEERMKFALKTDKGEFKLYTVDGQLGSGKNPTASPLK